MDLDVYLERIGCSSVREPTLANLVPLHRQHMFSVPFENLDISLGRPIILSLDAIFNKIIRLRRGGFCYELNGLFAWLLKELRFSVTMLSARVFNKDRPGPDFDHMLLLVGDEKRHIADVGFGDSFVEPLPLDHGTHVQAGCAYRLEERGGTWTLFQKGPESDWVPQYVFNLEPHLLNEFEPMCHYQQTSPESSFTRKTVCSKATPTGRVTLSNGRLICTTDGRKQERQIADASEYRALLEKYFGIAFDNDVELDKLLAS